MQRGDDVFVRGRRGAVGVEIVAEEIGLSLRWTTTEVTRATTS